MVPLPPSRRTLPPSRRVSDPPDPSLLQAEFARAARGFAERTKGRFDGLDAVAFSRVKAGDVVAEVGAGTGAFLRLFEGVARLRIALDLTYEMLDVCRRDDPEVQTVQADAVYLPLRSRSVDLMTSAQVLHHVFQPVPFVREMRRAVTEEGHVLLVDQVASERYEEIAFMNELEALRDPSHATSRPPSALRMIVRAAGLDIIDEKIVSERSRLSKWMWPGEFPQERIDRVKDFIAGFGHETGMEFEPDGDDYIFTRRRIMILAVRAPASGATGFPTGH